VSLRHTSPWPACLQVRLISDDINLLVIFIFYFSSEAGCLTARRQIAQDIICMLSFNV
jgi:hypothetical protein